MRRALACLTLLWWFTRFDPHALEMVLDGGHVDPMRCEAQAAQHGYFTVLITVREVRDANGALKGRYQNACFPGPASLRSTVSVPVSVNIR